MTKKTKPKLAKLTPEEQFWTTVDEQAKYKIYEILTGNIPLQNIKPILENWRYEDRQTKLVGLFLEKDVDYRTIESELESQYDEAELPTPDYLSQELAYHYLRAVVKGIITSLSAYDCHDPTWWENLTEN